MCSSKMDDCDTPRFTVNQIVLLQKLRQSGLNKSQILKGLEEIDKLDDMGLGSPGMSSAPPLTNGNHSGASPSSHCSTSSTGNGPSQSSAPKESDSHRNSSTPPSPRVKFNPGGVSHHMNQPNPLMFGAHLQNPNQLSLLPPVASWPNTSQAVAVATAASLLQNGFPHGTVPPSVYPSLMNGRGLLRNGSVGGNSGGSTIVDIDDEKVDITEELDELFRRDQAAVKEDIRKFISERHISQSAIAKATRNAISQSYISQWLAQPQDISGQKKKAMYTWFIIEKRKPSGITNGLNMSMPVSYRSSELDQDMMSPMLLKSKRGARFTWPKECLTILENYYNANSYPDECKREEIAHACNSIIQSQKPGMVLSELDKVTTVKVYNWFANRRKDDKRRRHIEHIESMGHQHLGLSPRRNSTLSPTPSCNSNDSHLDGECSSNVNERVSTNIKKEDPMSLALEMAAVNHSILALVNPHNDSTSQDDDEDEEQDSSFEHAQNEPYPQKRAERMTECRSYAG